MASDCFWESEGQEGVGARSWQCHRYFPSAAAARDETRNAQEKDEKKAQKRERIEDGWMKEGSEPAGPLASAPPPSVCC